MGRLAGSEELTFTYDKAPTAGEVAELIKTESLETWKLTGVEARRSFPVHSMGLTFGHHQDVWDVKFRKDRTV